MDAQEIHLLGPTLTEQMSRLGVPFDKQRMLAYLKKLNTQEFKSPHQKKVLLARVKDFLRRADQGGIHPIWKWDGTITGRFGCTQPGLLNTTRELRACVMGVSTLDISSFEYIVALSLAEEQDHLKLYHEGKDPYEHLASKLNTDRDSAKVFTLACMFGATPFGTASRLNITEQEAAQHLMTWWALHPRLATLRSDLITDFHARKFVFTDILKKPISILVKQRSFFEQLAPPAEESQAFATYIQGTAADIIKVAFVRLWQAGFKIHAVVHDEFMIAGKNANLTQAQDILNSVDSRFKFRCKFKYV